MVFITKERLLGHIKKSLIAGGLAINLGGLLVLLGLLVFLEQPVGHFIDKLGNHLNCDNSGSRQRVGYWLIRFGISEDWGKASAGVKPAKASPLVSAANPQKQYQYQTFDKLDRPVVAQAGTFLTPLNARSISVETASELTSAVRAARPGDAITQQPGRYRLSGRSVPVTSAGSRTQPIYVRAEVLGSSHLEFNMLEGFHVQAPFWVFENLDIRGTFTSDSNCEYAFHIVGQGSAFTLRNSLLQDFNAAIKVNSAPVKGSVRTPDNGLIEYNQFTHSRPRATATPVTPINIDSVNNWGDAATLSPTSPRTAVITSATGLI